MKIVHTIEDFGPVPLRVSGDLMSISYDGLWRSSKQLTLYEAVTWIEENCRDSSIVSEDERGQSWIRRDRVVVEVSPSDLKDFCGQWVLADGAFSKPGVQCKLLRYGDYVLDVRRRAAEHFEPSKVLQRNEVTPIMWVYESTQEANERRWKDLYRLRHVDGQLTNIESLDGVAREKLESLRGCLCEIERWAYAELLKIRGRVPDKENPRDFRRHPHDNIPFPGDFYRLDEVKIEIQFVLSESDPRFDDDDDNYMYEFIRSVPGMAFDCQEKWDTGFSEPTAGQDDGGDGAGSGSVGFLYDYMGALSGLDLADLLSIGSVYVDMIYAGSYVSKSLTDAHEIRPRVALARCQPEPLLFREREVFCPKSCEEEMLASVQFDDLSDQDQEHCRRLNGELSLIEHQSNSISGELVNQLNARLADENDSLDDYEIELYVSHILHPDDEMAVKPRYNVLVQQPAPWPLKSKRSGEDVDDLYFNFCLEFQRSDWSFSHCWLFHDLYDHHDISWIDLPRIDRVHASLEVWLQRWVTVGS